MGLSDGSAVKNAPAVQEMRAMQDTKECACSAGDAGDAGL